MPFAGYRKLWQLANRLSFRRPQVYARPPLFTSSRCLQLRKVLAIGSYLQWQQRSSTVHSKPGTFRVTSRLTGTVLVITLAQVGFQS